MLRDFARASPMTWDRQVPPAATDADDTMTTQVICLRPTGMKMSHTHPAADANSEKADLILGHGFTRRMLVGLIRAELAAADHEVMKAGGKTVEVVRRITAEG
jgi:hypothetical protein